MKKVLERFGGAIILYLVIFFGIVAISSRVAYIQDTSSPVVGVNK